MKAKGYIMTSPGNMMCGKLLHIRARNRASNWEETVLKCLKLVEADGASSVSFPALGTGNVYHVVRVVITTAYKFMK